MRDAFLIFLLLLAGAVLGGYGWFAIWLLRAAAQDDSDDEDAGCGLWMVLIFAGGIAISLAAALIGVVGHAVGVDMTQLTSGW